MSDLYGIMSLAGQALLTQQQAISVTSHNIANVNTPGYSRQRLTMATRTPLDSTVGPIGNGVTGTEIERIYDRFLGVQMNNENQSLGQWEAHNKAVEMLEIIFNEADGSGLSPAMSEFWNAWQTLTNNPSGQAERQALITQSQIMASTFNRLDSNLNQSRQDLDFSIIGSVQEINRLSEQIADLNAKIISMETGTQSANDYRDQRDLTLSELSKLIDIHMSEDTTGAISVLTANGCPLVAGSMTWQLSTETNASGFQDVVWVDGSGSTTNITGDISGGKLRGWLQVRDVVIGDYQNRLDSLAQTLINEVNTLHLTGFALDGSGGEVFFNGTAAADIEVNANIVADPDLVAAASDPIRVPGDNTKAIEITDLQYQLTMSANTATFSDYFSSLIRDVGTEVIKSDSYYDHQAEMVAYLDNYRESISGVSLDEEMINLIKFQNAYTAAAKLITTADELMESVLNMI
jgi:flagellar hook-associated protein 1 FlgK